ncbi:glycosyltransferase family 39 protein [Enterobacter mori]|uniref:Glycosyltransferase family 39 protein n=1 Tax=Enterobacter mori TaxID=539813 RepID=A0A7T0DXY4_9ENTR|nr:glycosyltransferase family 39 protein [Enterobacter mori]QPK01398.1 glycosyltransferase family 39 protein [Enterobacter mori]
MSFRFVILWVVIYAFAWTVATVNLDPAVPYDAVEALNWAQNAEWGSPKNPWLVGLMMRPALWLPPHIYWYACHFFAIAVGMAGSWLLALRLSNSHSLAWFSLLTLNLSGVINFDIISYNDNYLLVMLWPWMVLCYFQAITRHVNWWLPFALLAGLASMAKYSSLILIGFIFLSTLIVPAIRRCYRHPVWYLAIVLALMLIAPNVVWLWQHNFAAFRWVGSQIHFEINSGVLTCVLSVFYPLLISGAILWFCGVRFHWPRSPEVRVLLGVYTIPLVLVSGWFLIFSSGRLTEWLQPFFILAPALMSACIRRPGMAIPRSGTTLLFSFALLVFVGYIGVMGANVANAGKKMSGVIPFADKVNQLWTERYGKPLNYVGGGYLSEWLTFYVPSKPQIITRWHPEFRPNIYNSRLSESELQRAGAVLVGDLGVTCKDESFTTVHRDWPTLPIDGTTQILFQADPSGKQKVICIGFIRPG